MSHTVPATGWLRGWSSGYAVLNKTSGASLS